MGVTDPLYRDATGYYYFGGEVLCAPDAITAGCGTGESSSVYIYNQSHQSVMQWYHDWCDMRMGCSFYLP